MKDKFIPIKYKDLCFKKYKCIKNKYILPEQQYSMYILYTYSRIAVLLPWACMPICVCVCVCVCMRESERERERERLHISAYVSFFHVVNVCCTS